MKTVAAANCERKTRYASEALALSSAARVSTRRRPIFTYSCPECGFWHLTKQPRKCTNLV